MTTSAKIFKEELVKSTIVHLRTMPREGVLEYYTKCLNEKPDVAEASIDEAIRRGTTQADIQESVSFSAPVQPVVPINHDPGVDITDTEEVTANTTNDNLDEMFSAIPQPDKNGEFLTPADGAKFMAATYQIPQIPLRGKAPWFQDWPAKATLGCNQIDAWFAEFKCNFGSVAKADLQGRFVIEVDSPEVRQRMKKDGVVFTSEVIVESRPGRGHRWHAQSDESLALGNLKQDYSEQGDFSVRVSNEQCVSPGSINPVSGSQYRLKKFGEIKVASTAELEWLKKQEKSKLDKKEIKRNENGRVPHGLIHDYMLKLAGKLRRNGLTGEEIEPVLLRKVHEDCEPPIDDSKVKQMAHSIENFSEGDPLSQMVLFKQSAMPLDEKVMPDPLNLDAYYGIVRRHLRNIELNSEAHPAGILALFLSGFGSIVGTSAYMRVEDNLHYPMVNVIVTGQSSRSRKDTAMGRALRPLKAADPIWGTQRIKQGFSSGEAVVSYFERLHRLNMPMRLFVTDTEFKTTLTICAREGNTLSEVYRHMFNGDPLEVNVKKTKDVLSVPYSCGTSAGLITKLELRDVLKESEMVSGFVNRYMTILVHRVRKISRPSRMTDPDLIAERNAIVVSLQTVLEWIESRKEEIDSIDGTKGIKMSWDDVSGQAWDEFYNALGDQDADYLTRAEVFVMRLSMIYALLDMTATIRIEHLKAALALWKYAEQSSKLVYEDSQPSNVVKVMNRALASGYVKRGAVHNMTGKHMSGEWLDWVMEEAARISKGRLEVSYRLYKGEQMVESLHHVGKK